MACPGHVGTGGQEISSTCDVHRLLSGHLSEALERPASACMLWAATTLWGWPLFPACPAGGFPVYPTMGPAAKILGSKIRQVLHS